jgi:hypothetical protein
MASQKLPMLHVPTHYGHPVLRGYEEITDQVQMFRLQFLKER